MPITVPSQKSTKVELLRAYEEIRQEHERLKQQQLQPLAESVRKKEETQLLEKVVSWSPGILEQDIFAVRKKANQTLEELLAHLTQEAVRLQEIREAIGIEKKYLEEVRNIKLADETLQMLFIEHDQKQQEFFLKHKEMEDALTEEMNKRKKDWLREQEEYDYDLKIKRRAEEDRYQAELTKRRAIVEEEWRLKEKSLVEREELLKTQEAEFIRLRSQVQTLPDEINEAVEQANASLKDSLQKEFDVETRMLSQEWKADKQILEARIMALQETLKNQSVELRVTKDSFLQANQQAQTLAATVIESVSGVKQVKAIESGVAKE